MTEKMAKLLRIEQQQKFQSKKAAENEADAICSFANRLVRKNGWACKAIVVISENDLRKSKPSFIRNGKRGRPTKVFVPKKEGMKVRKEKPHLHIIMYGYPGQTIANNIVKNINKRFRKRNPNAHKKVVSRSFNIDKGYIPYVINQSSGIRRVNYDPVGLLDGLSLM